MVINNSSFNDGAGGSGQGNKGRVACDIPPPRPRPFPWPYPYSATQGDVGGAGGNGRVTIVNIPKEQLYYSQWPYQVPSIGWLPNQPVKMRG